MSKNNDNGRKSPIEEGYVPLKKGYKPTKGAVTGGHKPEKSVLKPTNPPKQK